MRDGERRGYGGGGRGRLYTDHYNIHCYHHNDACIKVGSDESHLNVSLVVRDKVTRQCPQTTAFEERGEPKRNRTEVLLLTSLSNALPLGQTGSNDAATERMALSLSLSLSIYIYIYIYIQSHARSLLWTHC